MAKEIVRFCPLCQKKRNFLRVVEAHLIGEPFTSSTLIGGPSHSWIQRTAHPTAYCPVCHIVLFVGPSADEVERNFKEEEEKKRKEKIEEELGRGLELSEQQKKQLKKKILKAEEDIARHRAC